MEAFSGANDSGKSLLKWRKGERDGEKGNKKRSKVKLMHYNLQASHENLYALSEKCILEGSSSSWISTF